VDSKKLKISDVQRLASLGMNDAAPFSLEDVFAKTELAMRELKRADSSLPQRLKTVLMLIDGRTPYGSFARSLRAYGPVDELFMLLRDTGYIMHTGRTEFFSSTTTVEAPGVAMAAAKLRTQSASLIATSSTPQSQNVAAGIPPINRQSVAEILGDPALWELPVITQDPKSAARVAPVPLSAPPVQALSAAPVSRVVHPAPAPLSAPITPRERPLESAVSPAPKAILRPSLRAAAQEPASWLGPSLAAQSRALKLSSDLLCDAVSEHAGFEGMELLLALERCVLIADLKALLPQAKALLEPAMGPAPLQSLMQRIDAALAL
jgi:hypothetical protein